MLSLDKLKIGEGARVLKVACSPAESQRLMEMGLTIGSTVKILNLAPMGDPIEILVRGYHLSLRKSEARFISVEPV